mgnify:CR=1 FL=1
MSVLCYACALEIAPGITVPIGACTVDDLAAAHALQERKETVLAEVARLVADAARYDLPISDELRERLALFAGGLDELLALRCELEETLLQPA